MTSLKKKLHDKAHLEATKGTDEENQTYCKKDGKVLLEIGEPVDHKKASVSNTYKKGVRMAKQMAQRDCKVIELIEEDGELAKPYFLYKNVIECLRDDILELGGRLDTIEEIGDPLLREWQKKLFDELVEKPDRRKIVWYVDWDGNCGKTFIATYLKCHSSCKYIENAKSGDIKYAYSGQKIVIFDLTKSVQEKLNYQALESVKNGIFFSPKYESTDKTFPIPHVVVFANWPPEDEKMSADRWEIRYISEKNGDCRLTNKYASRYKLPPKRCTYLTNLIDGRKRAHDHDADDEAEEDGLLPQKKTRHAPTPCEEDEMEPEDDPYCLHPRYDWTEEEVEAERLAIKKAFCL